MTQANDSFRRTADGTGVDLATHLVGAKEYPVMMRSNVSGHILGTLPNYTIQSGYLAGTAGKVYIDLFNATGSTSVVKVRKLFIQPNLAATALGAQTWDVIKTNVINVGGTALTPRAHDSTNPAVPAQVTAVHTPTTASVTEFTWFTITFDPEETRPAVGLQPYFNLLPTDGDEIQDYTLRASQGVKVVATTGGAYTWNVLAVISIE